MTVDRKAVSRAWSDARVCETHPELQHPTTMAFFPRHSGFSWHPGCFDECVMKPWNSSVENDGIRGSPEKPVAMMTAGEHAVSLCSQMKGSVVERLRCGTFISRGSDPSRMTLTVQRFVWLSHFGSRSIVDWSQTFSSICEAYSSM